MDRHYNKRLSNGELRLFIVEPATLGLPGLLINLQ